MLSKTNHHCIALLHYVNFCQLTLTSPSTQDKSFALYYASWEGHSGIIELLLQEDAVVNLQNKVRIAEALLDLCHSPLPNPSSLTHPPHTHTMTGGCGCGDIPSCAVHAAVTTLVQ